MNYFQRFTFLFSAPNFDADDLEGNRVAQISSGKPVRFAGVVVHEVDYVVADRCGTVFGPAARIEEVVDLGERIAKRQDGMVKAVRAGRAVAEVMHDKEFEAIYVKEAK